MRKALSILVALTIIIGMMPTTFASTTEEPYAKTYEFTRDAIGKTSGKYALSSVDSYDSYDGKATNHDWKFFGYSGNLSKEQEDGNSSTRVGYMVDKSNNALTFKLKSKSINKGNFALSLKAPTNDKSGFYLPSVEWRNLGVDIKFSWYLTNKLGNTFDGTTDSQYFGDENLMSVPRSGDDWVWQSNAASKAIYVSGGEDIVAAFKLNTQDYSIGSITLTQIINPEIEIAADKAVDGTIAFTTTDTDKSATITSTKIFENGDNPIDVAGGFVEYKSDNTEVATVDALTGEIKAGNVDGTAKIWAQSPDGKVKSNEIKVMVIAPQDDEEISKAFTITEEKEAITSYNVGTVLAVAYTLGTDKPDNSIVVTARKNENGTYTLNAPEYDGYKFLYWKKGVTTKKDVITYKPSDFVYAPTACENNIVIAVYEKNDETTTNKAEFYNANGQFILATDGSFPEEIPSLAGFGDATGWKCYTDGKTYGLTDSVIPSGTMLFVADYKDEPKVVDITVNKGYGDNHSASFGTLITCSPIDAPEGQVFRCWTKTNVNGKTEIVSVDEEYSFYAYEDCIVTALFADKDEFVYNGNSKKIILDSFSAGSLTALMAEFIGFENDTVVEKGIMFKNNRIAMKSIGTQFTIIPDGEGMYKGYAIVKNDDGSFTLITDGEYEVTEE